MLGVLAAVSLGAQACGPVQAMAASVLGQPGEVTVGSVGYPGTADAPGCVLQVHGNSQMGSSFASVAAKLDQAILGAGWTRDINADADGPEGTAAGYIRPGEQLAVSVNQTGRGAALAFTVVLGLRSAAGATTTLSEPGATPLDLACLSSTAWAVDPAGDRIQVFGCRPVADIPPPDADGFTTFQRPAVDGLDGGFTRVKPNPDAPSGQISFVVQDNTGGSFTAQATVTGVLGEDGYMAAEGLTVQ